MARRRSSVEPSNRQTLQILSMFQNLIGSLDTVGLQRLMEAREVMSALADGRLTPKKAMASLGLTVALDGRSVKMDFFGLRKDSDDDEVLDAFRRQGLRPVNASEYRAFETQHHDAVHDIVVRSRFTLVLMGERVRIPSHRQRDVCWGYPVLYRSRDGNIVRDAECIGGLWDKSYRFLGVRLDRRPRHAAIPTVSISHISPKVRPSA